MRRTIPLTAIALGAALLVPGSAAAAQLPLDMKVTAEEPSVLTNKLKLRAKCASACTIELDKVNAMQISRARGQLQGAATSDLSGTKRLAAGRSATFRIPLGPGPRAQVMSAVSGGRTALVQVAVKWNGNETYRQVTLHKRGVPKSGYGQDDITLSTKPRASKRGKKARYRVTIEGLQTTVWKYSRSNPSGNGCTAFSRGEGKQTTRFRSRKAPVASVLRHKLGTVFVNANGTAPLRVPLKLDLVRDGKVESGIAPAGCDGGTPSGDAGGKSGGPGQCRRTGSVNADAMITMLGKGLYTFLDPEAFHLAALAPPAPDCAIEPFLGASDDRDLQSAFDKLGDPTRQGGKVIAVLRRKTTDPLGGGSTSTTTRWTVTFKRVGG